MNPQPCPKAVDAKTRRNEHGFVTYAWHGAQPASQPGVGCCGTSGHDGRQGLTLAVFIFALGEV
jgi:hypothetical protein